jgi:hypothetical protein
VWQEEKTKTAGRVASGPIRGSAMERHQLWWHRLACGRKTRIKTAGRMPAILKYNFLYN